MPTDLERLDEADACHDDDPAHGAELLRAIDAAQVPPERRPNLAFLLNHVLGEKLCRWDEALRLQQQVIASAQPAPALVLWRQAATAARLAGDAALTRDFTSAFAHASGAPLERCAELLQVSAVMFRAPGLDGAQAGEEVLAALASLAQPGWHADSPLDASAAACTSNIASGLLDRPAAVLRQGAARAALVDSAEQAQRFWLRAGTWVQHERAFYTRAMVGNTLGEAAHARAHAQAALALIDAHADDHPEDVDRAFVQLERWRACLQLGLAAEAAEARRNADALAAQFNDAGLTQWFERREQALVALPPAA
jgi:hypothetical protein